MNVEKIMTREVKTCGLEDSLNTAAQVMWEDNCGCAPVVGGNGEVVGMITDRDVCMAAYTQGGPLRDLDVASAMANVVYSCRPGDSIEAAEEIMRAHQIRRLPVINSDGRLAGILSLNDIALAAQHERLGKGKRSLNSIEVAETLAAICEHTSPAAMPPAVLAAP